MIATLSEISKSFDKKAYHYDKAALMQIEIGTRLLDRLAYLKMSPRYILDLGCGTGVFSQQLTKLYPNALVVGLDLAPKMLLQAQKKQGIFRRWPLVAGNMQALPFANGVFDLVFANQAIHWGDSLALIFDEVNRVMRVDGCFMFTTLGPDTFQELKSAWAGVHSYAHVNEFKDMHDVGDLLMQSRFSDPVMDIEYLSVHYGQVAELVQSLKAQGVRNIHKSRNQGLTGRAAWNQFEQNYASMRTAQSKYPLTYEVVYGQAWKAATRNRASGTETLVAVDSIVRK